MPAYHRRERRPWRLSLHDGPRSALYRRELDRRRRRAHRLWRRDGKRSFANNGRVVAVSIGDGAFNQGSTHEGLAFAAARSLPVLIICENNGWSELTPTSLTFKVERIAQRASGYGMPGVTIDGTDPMVVRDTVKQAAKRAREGKGPVLIECRVPRLWGHYNRDIEHYRPKEDRDQARARDPIATFTNKLITAGVLTRDAFQELEASVKSEMDEVQKAVLSSPPPDAETAPGTCGPKPRLPASLG